MSAANDRPYQVCLYVGDAPPVLDGVKVVDLTPASLDQDAILAALRSSELAPSDLRAKAVFSVEPTDDPDRTRLAVATYAAAVGFAGRRLDVAVGTDLIDAEALDAAGRRLPDSGKPDPSPDHIQVGAEHPEIETVSIAGADPLAVAKVRYARRVRFVPASDPLGALTQLLALSSVRARDGQDRFPFLVEGDEPALTPETASEAVGVCLDTLRRAASELRRTLRSDNREALAEQAPLDARRRALLAASGVPIENTLSRLGANQDLDTSMWHCPRPERHAHGDANASMRVAKGKVRCYRCDAEHVDSLRLVMDAKGFTPDEAADWLAVA